MIQKQVFIICFVFALTLVNVLQAQQILIHGKLNASNKKDTTIPVSVRIVKAVQNDVNALVYQELNTLSIKDSGRYELLVGKGKQIAGFNSIDSIIWNLDEYLIEFGELNFKKKIENGIKHSFVLRKQSYPNSENQEGIVEAGVSNTHGNIEIPLSKKKIPKKITLDFTSSYINILYPGGRYPIFRHYEWYPSQDGKTGNCFMLTYSEKTTHEFWEGSEKFGDIRIHDKPFQSMKYKINQDRLQIFLSKTEEDRYLSETYAIKGPWKIIYLIEW